MHSHGFRKFFITQCDRCRMSFTVREYLSGHKLANQDASYIRTSEEDRLAEYVKAIPLLTIDPTQRLAKENQELKTERDDEIARLKWREGQQIQDISSLKERLNSTEESLNKVREIADDYMDLFVKSGKGQSTISRDIKVLKSKSQQFVFDLAKSDLAYYYKQSIDGIEEAKNEGWRFFNNPFVPVREKLLALKIIMQADETRFKLLSEGPSGTGNERFTRKSESD